jgi:hypothetical protein
MDLFVRDMSLVLAPFLRVHSLKCARLHVHVCCGHPTLSHQVSSIFWVDLGNDEYICVSGTQIPKVNVNWQSIWPGTHFLLARNCEAWMSFSTLLICELAYLLSAHYI